MGKHYDQFDLDDRTEISGLHADGISRRAIGRMMGRSASTISRRIPTIAWALSAALVTTSCMSVPQERAYSRSELPSSFDGGVGQLLKYCGKLRKAGKLVMAAGICERAYRLDPGNPEPLVQLAEILVELGQLEGAENVYRTIIEIAPDHIEARYMLGKTYIALEKYDLAIIELESAVSRKAGDPRIYNALGVANGLMGAHDSAQRVFRAGLQRAPDDTSLRNNLGLSLAMSGRYDEGISLLLTIEAGRNANRTSHQNLQLALSMAQAAKAENELALAAPPDGPEAPPADRQDAVNPNKIYDPLSDDAELVAPAEAIQPLDLSRQRAQAAVFRDFAPPTLPPGLPNDFEEPEPVVVGIGGDAQGRLGGDFEQNFEQNDVEYRLVVNGRHDLELAKTQIPRPGLAPDRPPGTEDIRDPRRATWHDGAGSAGRPASRAPMFRRALDRRHDDAGDTGVAGGRIQLLVPEQHLNHRDVELPLQAVGGKAVPEPARADSLVDPGRRLGAVEGTVELAEDERIGRVPSWVPSASRQHRSGPALRRRKSVRQRRPRSSRSRGIACACLR